MDGWTYTWTGICNRLYQDDSVHLCLVHQYSVFRDLVNPPSCPSAISVFTRILYSMICRWILLACETRAIVLYFAHCLRSPFMGSGMNVENVHSADHSQVSQTATHGLSYITDYTLQYTMFRKKHPLLFCSVSQTFLNQFEQVAQLSLTNPRDALHHNKRQNFKKVT